MIIDVKWVVKEDAMMWRVMSGNAGGARFVCDKRTNCETDVVQGEAGSFSKVSRNVCDFGSVDRRHRGY